MKRRKSSVLAVLTMIYLLFAGCIKSDGNPTATPFVTPVITVAANYSNYSGNWLCKDQNTTMYLYIDNSGNVSGRIVSIKDLHRPSEKFFGMVYNGLFASNLLTGKIKEGTISLSFIDSNSIKANVKLSSKTTYTEYRIADGEMLFVKEAESASPSIDYTKLSGDWFCGDKKTRLHLAIDKFGNVDGFVSTTIRDYNPTYSVSGFIENNFATAKLYGGELESLDFGTIEISFDTNSLKAIIGLNSNTDGPPEFKVANGEMFFVRDDSATKTVMPYSTQASPAITSDVNQKIYYGTWEIKKVFLTGTVSKFTTDEAKEFIGNKIIYSEEKASSGDDECKNPYYDERTFSEGDFTMYTKTNFMLGE